MNAHLRNLAALVVDDDPLLANLARRALTAHGVRDVTTVASGDDALKLLADPNRTFELLLCDLAMPGMDGVEFLRHLAERWYQGWIIVMSGQDGRVIDSVVNLASSHRLNVIGALHKPFAIKTLGHLLDQIGRRPPEHTEATQAEVTPEELARAIATQQLFVQFQPKMELCSGRICGVEALIRWNHPDKGLIGPASFIPIAERHSLEKPLTESILTQTLRQANRWRNDGIELQIALNVPAALLTDLSLPDSIAAAAAVMGISPSKLTIEVTETQLMQDVLKSLDTLNRLRLKGIVLSIDDFGTGYSSLSQLQLIPFQELKIDRTFVQRAVHDTVSFAIVESSVQLARRVGMRVVAEGVETTAQLALITEVGCDEAQGFHIARPMSGDDLATWLKQRSKSHGAAARTVTAS